MSVSSNTHLSDPLKPRQDDPTLHHERHSTRSGDYATDSIRGLRDRDTARSYPACSPPSHDRPNAGCYEASREEAYVSRGQRTNNEKASQRGPHRREYDPSETTKEISRKVPSQSGRRVSKDRPKDENGPTQPPNPATGPKPNGPKTPPHNPPRSINYNAESIGASMEHKSSRPQPPPQALQNQVFLFGFSLRQRLAELEEWCALAIDVEHTDVGELNSDDWETLSELVGYKIEALLYGVTKSVDKMVRLEGKDTGVVSVSQSLLELGRAVIDAQVAFREQWLGPLPEEHSANDKGQEEDDGYMTSKWMELSDAERKREMIVFYRKLRKHVGSVRENRVIEQDLQKLRKALIARAGEIKAMEAGKSIELTTTKLDDRKAKVAGERARMREEAASNVHTQGNGRERTRRGKA